MKDQKGIGNYFKIGEMLGYFFRKKNRDNKPNFNLKMMHGINRFSIIVFLGCLVYMIVKHFF